MSLPLPKPGVMDLPVYEPGKSAVKGSARVIKLSSNEAALGASPKALAAYNAAGGEMHRYPLADATELRQALGARNGLDPNRIICGAGSDELIGLLTRAYAGPGDEVVHSRHGFLMYDIYARGVGARPVSVPERDLTADIDAMLAAVTPNTRIVFIANPNNPTGTHVSGNALMKLRAGLREDIVLAIDDAYVEYVDAPDYQSGASLAATTPNTVTLRTFSKIYGLAGLRLGWAFGPAPIIDAMQRLRSPFNVTRPALAAALAALGDEDHIARQRAHNTKWLRIATQRLRGLGLKVPDSQGNFVLVEFPTAPGRTAPEADAFLQSHGIIVRRVDGYGLPNHLRITIGDDAEMDAVLDALTAFTERRGA